MAPDHFRRDAALVFLATLAFFCIGLGVRPYVTPSEARYIEIPRQMLATGDWLTPRINGVPYFEKPPLFYWMQASVMWLFGTDEFAGRITTAVLSALTCLVTFATGKLLYGRRAGLLAAMVLATSLLGYGLSRAAMLDVPVGFFLTCCFGCFLAAQAERRYYLPMYAAAALAVMSKGLIGVVLPGLVIGGWILLTRRWQVIGKARLVAGSLILLGLTAPWHVLMARQHPAFLDFYLVHEHFDRFLTDTHGRVEPWWFFVAVLPVGLLPWTFFLPSALRDQRSPALRGVTKSFLILWVVLPLLLFSSSHSKLTPYIFPILPPLAILIGQYLSQHWDSREAASVLRGGVLFIVLLFGLMIALLFLAPLPTGDSKVDVGSITPSMLLPTIIGLAGLAYVWLGKRPASVLIVGLALFAMTVEINANYVAGGLDRASVKPLLAQLQTPPAPEATVVAYGAYFQDLPVYLHRNVIVAGYVGELAFGVTHYPETHDWVITDEEFWKRCARSERPLYVFMRQSTFDSLTLPEGCTLRLMASYGKTVLLEQE